MKSYYDILEINKDADERQIKSAYFKLVRKYTPERFPEEFKQLRIAYETLSDANMRKEYDRTDNLPAEVAHIFSQVQKAKQEGRHSDAIDLLTMIIKLYPSFNEMRVELARMYEQESKIGKAIKVWEELCRLEPENSGYAVELGQAYRCRGWHKKALERFKYAENLDPDNTNALMGLIYCYSEAKQWEQAREFTLRAMEAAKKTNMVSIYIYTQAAVWNLKDGNKVEAEKGFQMLVDAIKNNKECTREECVAAVFELSSIVLELKSTDMLQYLRQMLDAVPEMENFLRKSLESSFDAAELDALEQEGYPEIIVLMLCMSVQNEDDDDDIASTEANILMDLQGYRPQIERLKKEYPHLYAKHAAFFDEVLTTSNPDKLLSIRLKKLSKKGFVPIAVKANQSIEDYEQSQRETYRREGPKIGRNDPCHCGSGKKYKKCCGAS